MKDDLVPVILVVLFVFLISHRNVNEKRIDELGYSAWCVMYFCRIVRWDVEISPGPEVRTRALT